MNNTTWQSPGTTRAYQADPSDFTTNSLVQLLFYLLYATIFFLGIFGNVLVCFVVAINTQMQTVTNLFITNLAVSDILLCILAVPFTPLYTFLGRWIFGSTLCRLVPFTQGVSIYISTFTLTGIAIDRFFVICHPFRPRMKIKNCLLIIFGIWIISLGLTLPYGIYMSIESPHFCEEHWPSQEFRKIFGSFTSILQFLLPFFIIAVCYIFVSIKLRVRARSKPGCKSSKKYDADRERTRRTNRMLIAMVTIFGGCWMPINIVNIVDDFFDGVANNWLHYRLCFFITHCLAMSSTCYNPLLYAWLNENFRIEFKKVLPCFRKVTTNLTSKTTTTGRNEGNGEENLMKKIAGNKYRESIQLDSRPTSTTPFQPSERTLNEFTDIDDVIS